MLTVVTITVAVLVTATRPHRAGRHEVARAERRHRTRAGAQTGQHGGFSAQIRYGRLTGLVGPVGASAQSLARAFAATCYLKVAPPRDRREVAGFEVGTLFKALGGGWDARALPASGACPHEPVHPA